jgi:hypothetical protein
MEIQNETESNTQYQTELLNVFGLSKISDTLSTLVEKLYHEINYPFMKEILDYIPVTFSSDPVILFMCLFSYDYFKYTHELIVNILLKKDTTLVHQQLLSILKK